MSKKNSVVVNKLSATHYDGRVLSTSHRTRCFFTIPSEELVWIKQTSKKLGVTQGDLLLLLINNYRENVQEDKNDK